MLLLKNKKAELNLNGYTVIIPSICVGNAAQLAIDLLISSKKLQRVGSIVHSALIPVFGPSAYQHTPEDKSASCELYLNNEEKLFVVQFRAPLISRHAVAFNKYLIDLCKEARRVIILSGSFGFEKHTIEESPYAYRASDSFKAQHSEQLTKAVKWQEHTGEFIFGGGNSMQLYKAFDEEKVPVMLLFRYLLEGDNSTEAAQIVRELNELCEDFLQISKTGEAIKLTVPVSWNLIFGNDVIEALF